MRAEVPHAMIRAEMALRLQPTYGNLTSAREFSFPGRVDGREDLAIGPGTIGRSHLIRVPVSASKMTSPIETDTRLRCDDIQGSARSNRAGPNSTVLLRKGDSSVA